MRRLVVCSFIVTLALGAVLVSAPSANAARPTGNLVCLLQRQIVGPPERVLYPFDPGQLFARTPGDAARLCRADGGHPVGVIID